MIAYDICERGILKEHVKKIRDVYRERRNAMNAALQKYWPQAATGRSPSAGSSCGRSSREG